MTLAVMRKSFKIISLIQKIIARSHKIFSHEEHRETLMNNLSKENFINNDDGFQMFFHISLHALKEHAPRKKNHVRGI